VELSYRPRSKCGSHISYCINVCYTWKRILSSCQLFVIQPTSAATTELLGYYCTTTPTTTTNTELCYRGNVDYYAVLKRKVSVPIQPRGKLTFVPPRILKNSQPIMLRIRGGNAGANFRTISLLLVLYEHRVERYGLWPSL